VTREDLCGLVVQTSREELPSLVGALAEAQAEAIARLAAPAPTVTEARQLVALTEEWAEAHGFRLETAKKLARSGRLRGAQPAPSRGKGRKRRWLVPATLRVAV
jgi:hypothetical protein